MQDIHDALYPCTYQGLIIGVAVSMSSESRRYNKRENTSWISCITMSFECHCFCLSTIQTHSRTVRSPALQTQRDSESLIEQAACHRTEKAAHPGPRDTNAHALSPTATTKRQRHEQRATTRDRPQTIRTMSSICLQVAHSTHARAPHHATDFVSLRLSISSPLSFSACCCHETFQNHSSHLLAMSSPASCKNRPAAPFWWCEKLKLPA